MAVAKPAPAPAPAVAPVAALVAPEVEFAAADGKITLKGKIADERTKDVLLSEARRTFGDGNVIDKIEIVSGRGPLAWIGSTRQLLSDFRDMPAPASIAAGAGVVTLTGVVDSEAVKDLRGKQARAHFGEGVTIANAIMVKPPKVAQPDAVKIDCATITRGAQVAFATGSAELTEEGKAALDSIAPCLTDGKWEIGGHTDNAGSNEVNQPLSWRRAAAAVEYLRQSKGEATPLKAVGYGAIDPIAANDTDDGRARNRRLTFKKIKY